MLKMSTAYIVFLGMGLTGVLMRTGYELFKQSGKVTPKNKVVFCLVFVAMCLMLSSWCFMCPLDPWRISVAGIVKFSGLGMLLTGAGTALAGLIQLRGVEDIDHLVTGGVFSRVRHPMYTGFILWIIGWIIYYGAVASIFTGLFCIANILYWRWIEEEKMGSDYGEAYMSYRMKTWF